MAIIYYKKLFEVRILHEYYLRDNNHPEFFALNTADRENLLTEKLRHHQYDIGQDLSIAPSAVSERLMQGHHLRFVQRPTGFFMGIRVKPVNNQFFPYIPLSNTLRLTFTLAIRNPYFKNITHDPLSSTIPGIYYLSNANTENNKTFPALSTPVAVFQPGRLYAMGDLAVIGSELMEALESTDTPDPGRWKKLNASGLVHAGERLLLPKQFIYRFNRNKNVTTAAFTLKTMEDVVVKQISFTQPERLDQVNLNLLFSNAEVEIPDGFYQLEVSGNDNFQEQRKIYLSNDLYNPGYFGVINMRQHDTDFRLWETDGSLLNPAPVFEIRLKSRSTYWRYVSDEGKKLKVTPKTAPYLTAVQGILHSRAPLPFSRMPVEFRKEDPAVERVFLPNPPDTTFRPENDGRLYSNIYLSPIKDLIAEDV